MDTDHVDVGAVELGQALGGQDLLGVPIATAVDHEQDLVDQREHGSTSCVTKSTLRPVRAASPTRSVISRWWRRSRCANGGSQSRSRGSPTRAWAIRRRCRSPPDRRPTGAPHRGRPPPRRSRWRAPRSLRSGRPTPQRRPSTPSRTRSRPRRGMSRSSAWGLRHIADRRVAPAGRFAEHLHRTGAHGRPARARPAAATSFPSRWAPARRRSCRGSNTEGSGRARLRAGRRRGWRRSKPDGGVGHRLRLPRPGPARARSSPPAATPGTCGTEGGIVSATPHHGDAVRDGEVAESGYVKRSDDLAVVTGAPSPASR